MTVTETAGPTLADPSAGLVEQILDLHGNLSAEPHLEPAPAVNRLFQHLVELCGGHDGAAARAVLGDPRIARLDPPLVRLCAAGEHLLERHWARRIVAGEEPDQLLASFPYLTNYEQLTLLELRTLAGLGADLGAVRRVCFLGSGPLPLSALLLSRELGVPVDAVDVDREAVTLGARVAGRLSLAADVRFHHADAAAFTAVADSQVVVLAALVGLDQGAKRDVVQELSRRMPSGSLLLVRSSHGLRTLLYPPVDPADLPGWRPLGVVHPFTTVVNSVVVALRP